MVYKHVEVADFLERNGAFYGREIQRQLGVKSNVIQYSKTIGVMSAPDRNYHKRSRRTRTHDLLGDTRINRIYFTGNHLFDAIGLLKKDVIRPEEVTRGEKCALKILIENRFSSPIDSYLLDYFKIGVNDPRSIRRRKAPPFYEILHKWSYLTAEGLAKKINLNEADSVIIPELRGLPIAKRVGELYDKPIITLKKTAEGLHNPIVVNFDSVSNSIVKKLYVEAEVPERYVRGKRVKVFDDGSRTFKTVDVIREFVWRNGGEVEAAVLLATDSVAQEHPELSCLTTLPSF